MQTNDFTVKVFKDEEDAKNAWLARMDAQAAANDAVIRPTRS